MFVKKEKNIQIRKHLKRGKSKYFKQHLITTRVKETFRNKMILTLLLLLKYIITAL